MSLNRRTGLYAIPSHHLHGAWPAPCPTYNSMDFADEEADPPAAIVGPVEQVKDEKKSTTPQRKDKKKKKRQSMFVESKHHMDDRTPITYIPLIDVTPATASTEGKKNNNSQEHNATQSDKKRKRASEDHIDLASTLPKPSGNGGFIVGTNMLQNVQSSVKAAGGVFNSPETAANLAEGQSKKKSKKDKASRKSSDMIDFDRMAKETRSIDRKARKEKKKARRQSGGAAQIHSPVKVPLPVPAPSPLTLSSRLPRKTPVPIPQNAFSRAGAAKAHPQVEAPVPVPSPPIVSNLPRKTPVPLPENVFPRAVNTSKVDRIGRRDSRLLVMETPPSQLPKSLVNLPDSPIPFKLTDAAKTRKSKDNVGPSPPTPVMSEAPSSASPVLSKNHKLELKPDGRVSLTSSNLIKNTTTTQPLRDNSKTRPKPQFRAMSIAGSSAGSTTSGGTTPSIKDLFARVGKPYSRSGAEIDPFVVSEAKKKVTRESHEESSGAEFTERYRAVQKTVNFSDEREYLDHARNWRTDNSARGPLPCLGQKASGCNTKRETILRLNHADPSSYLTVLVASTAEQATLNDAKHRAATAQSFLAMAITARVPVPLGAVEGTWKLFCPAYSDAHIDRYGYGQRSLSIFSIAGFGGQETAYTARLSIPPRSMLFSILSFSVPPHASFRPTTLRTSAEGYRMDVLFLGNGYLLLRVDVRLLLSGKEMQTSEGRSVVMEFVGVHESAVVWREEEDELEVVGRKLFARYDGGGLGG